MRKRRIYIWMGVVSVLLIVLVIAQLQWIKEAAKAEAQVQKQHVMKAIERTEQQLRADYYCFETYSKAYFGVGEGFYMLRQRWNKKGFYGKPDTLKFFFDTERQLPDTVLYKSNTLQDNYPIAAEIHMSFLVAFKDSAADPAQKRSQYENQMGKRLGDVLTSNKPIDSILNMQTVDTLLARNLQQENITIPFGFGLVQKGSNHIDYARRIQNETDLLTSPYSVRLFADNKFFKPYLLAVVFNQKVAGYINYWLFMSVAIILLLTIAFYSFIRIYIRQTRLSEMKSDFINNLTHEFNTPMANISLAIETMSEQGQVNNPKLNKILNIISSESTRLRDNIERALQVATMEKNDLHLHKEKIDLAAMITTALPTYQLQCEQLGGHISFSHPSSVYVIGDETHLLNCMFNLLDNAIKYRRNAPEITVILEEKHDKVMLAVQDNGKGMSSDTMKHIFEKFYRAHEGDVHNTKGFGLGLSYVKGIIQAHGGHIEVTSKKDIGTHFIIYLPKAM